VTVETNALPPLGLLHQMWAPPGVRDRDLVRDALREIKLAETLGFESVWIGEHHLVRDGMAFYGRIPAAELFLGHIAANTRRITVGTGVKVLTWTTALRAAEEMSTLDLLTEGRAEFGLGTGLTEPGSAETREQKYARFRAMLDDLLRLLAGDVSTGLPRLSPTPSPSLARKLWIAARDEETIALAARRGLNLVVGQAEITERQVRLVRAFREAGGTGLVRGVRLVFVAPTREQAVAESGAAVATYFAQMAGKYYHKEAVEAGALPSEARTLEEMRRQVSFLAGTPDEVARMLNDHIARTGLDQLDLMVQVPGVSSEAVVRSLRLIQDEVRPRLRFTPAALGPGPPAYSIP
jgi:alkanesulfonate monooxygenase SsuD/methylene tetrahydromethanopterin reductase-like flavin-dependent oxidoreductase (luciferase family)